LPQGGLRTVERTVFQVRRRSTGDIVAELHSQEHVRVWMLGQDPLMLASEDYELIEVGEGDTRPTLLGDTYSRPAPWEEAGSVFE
jgi:hypothetical protein